MISPLWQVVAAYVFALAGGSVSTSLRLEHKPLCALISLAAGTLLGVTLFAIAPESLSATNWWAAMLAAVRYQAIDVSLEADDNDPAHSKRSLLRGRYA